VGVPVMKIRIVGMGVDHRLMPVPMRMRLRDRPIMLVMVNVEVIVSGIADAVAYDAEGRIEVIIDWKSDVEIDAERVNSYHGQLDACQRHSTTRFLGADDAGKGDSRLAHARHSASR
jgi:hypothetical protein